MHRQCMQGVDFDLALVSVIRIFIGLAFARRVSGATGVNRSVGCLNEVLKYG